jgi:hypothetical protein
MGWTRKTGTAAALVAGALALSLAANAQAAGIPFVYNSGEDVFESAKLPADLAAAVADIEIANGELDPSQRDAEIAMLTPDLTTMSVGWRCSILGVFYAYLAWWGCEQVLYKWTSAEEFEYMPLDLAKFEAHIKTTTSDPDEIAGQVAIQKAVIAALEQKAGGKKITEAYPLSDVKMGFWKKNGRLVIGGVIVLLLVFGILKMTVWKKAKATPPPAVGGFPPPANYPPPGAGGFPPPGAPPANYPPPSG